MSKNSKQNLKKSGEKNAETGNHPNQSQTSIAQTITGESGSPPNIPPAVPRQCGSNDDANRRNSHRPNWCEILTLILEFVGIIGLGIYCLYTWKEWKTFDSERQTMEKEFLDGQRTKMEDERAWVTVSQVVPERREFDMHQTFFTVQFKNTGKTPALKVVEWHDSGYDLRNDKDWGGISPSNASPRDFSGMLGPDAVGSFNTGDKEMSDDQAAFMEKTAPSLYFVYGKIWYQDIFGTNHWTEFCYAISLDPKFNAWQMTTHNSCDEAN